MRLKVSDMICFFDEYLRPDGMNEPTLDIGIYNIPENPEDTNYLYDIMVKEMLDHKGMEHVLPMKENTSSGYKVKKYPLEYIVPFDEFISEGFQKRPPQDPDYDDRPEGWRDGDWDEDEEE